MKLDTRIKLTRQMEAAAEDGSLSPEVLMIGEVSAAVEIVSSVESDRAAIQTADFKVRASPATTSVRMQDRVEWQGKHYAIESITPDRIDRPKWLTFRGATSQDGSASGMRGTPYQEPAPTTIAVVIGTVTTGEPGTDAEAEITGSAPTFTLNLTIPRGADGADGADGGGGGSSTWAGPNTFQVRLASGAGAPTLITVGNQFSMSGNTLSLATEYAAASTVSALASDVSALSSAVSASLATKADNSTTITAAGLATGGGSLASNRTITVTAASGAEVITGTEAAKAITPAAIAGARSIGGATSDEGKLTVFAADGSLRCATSFSVFNGAHEHTFLSAATAARLVTFPDKAGTVAMLDDITTGSAAFSKSILGSDVPHSVSSTYATLHTFTVGPGKTAIIDGKMMGTTAATTTGIVYGIQVDNSAGNATATGSTIAEVSITSAVSAAGLLDGDVISVAAAATTAYTTLGTAAASTGNHPCRLNATVCNNSTSGNLTVNVVMTTEVNGSAVTAKAGSIATAIIF